jgi:hypothetical protein
MTWRGLFQRTIHHFRSAPGGRHIQSKREMSAGGDECRYFRPMIKTYSSPKKKTEENCPERRQLPVSLAIKSATIFLTVN